MGVAFGNEAKAYPVSVLSFREMVNDMMGSFPVVVWAANDNFHAYIRQVNDQLLAFQINGDKLIDNETGSIWDLSNGLAIDGVLRGQGLTAVPSMSSYDWAWSNFYPDTKFYTPQPLSCHNKRQIAKTSATIIPPISTC